MNKRITYLRKQCLGKSMEEFGKEIGVTKSAVSKLESGSNTPSEQTIKLICEKYNVRREWLLEGKGDPFIEFSRDEEITQFVAKSLAEEGETVQKNALRILSHLTYDEWQVLASFMDKIKKG